MKTTRKAKTTNPSTAFDYRTSIMKPGAARIALYGDCNPFLGGTPDECCIFVNVAAALDEVAALRASRGVRSIPCRGVKWSAVAQSSVVAATGWRSTATTPV